jgi:hypothetical protein
MDGKKTTCVILENQYTGEMVSSNRSSISPGRHTALSEVVYDLGEAGELVFAELRKSMRRTISPQSVRLVTTSSHEVSVTLESPGGIDYLLNLDTAKHGWRERLARTVREVGHVGCS